MSPVARYSTAQWISVMTGRGRGLLKLYHKLFTLHPHRENLKQSVAYGLILMVSGDCIGDSSYALMFAQ